MEDAKVNVCLIGSESSSKKALMQIYDPKTVSVPFHKTYEETEKGKKIPLWILDSPDDVTALHSLKQFHCIIYFFAANQEDLEENISEKLEKIKGKAKEDVPIILAAMDTDVAESDERRIEVKSECAKIAHENNMHIVYLTSDSSQHDVKKLFHLAAADGSTFRKKSMNDSKKMHPRTGGRVPDKNRKCQCNVQ